MRSLSDESLAKPKEKTANKSLESDK